MAFVLSSRDKLSYLPVQLFPALLPRYRHRGEVSRSAAKFSIGMPHKQEPQLALGKREEPNRGIGIANCPEVSKIAEESTNRQSYHRSQGAVGWRK
jgi:hypothetical protein